jgi:hypothetical protein
MSLIEMDEKGVSPTYYEIIPELSQKEAPELYDLVHNYSIETPEWYKDWRETFMK